MRRPLLLLLALGFVVLGFCPLLLEAEAHDRRWTALPSGGSSGAAATTGPVTLYVDPNGSDAFDCSAADAGCATIQGALDKLPRELRHVATVNVAAGASYTGAQISGFYRGKVADPANGAYLKVVGAAYANSTVATGTATGTLTSVTAPTTSPIVWGTLNDTGQSWTVNDLRGKLLVITSGAGVGGVYPIISNTATAVTVPASSFTATTGSGYAIQDASSVVATAIALPATGLGAQTASYAGFLVDSPGLAGQNGAGIYFDRLKVTTARGIVVNGGGGDIVLNGSQVTASTNAVSLLSRGSNANVIIQNSYVSHSGSSSAFNFGAFPNGAKSLSTSQTAFRGGGTGTGVFIGSGWVGLNTTHIENFAKSVVQASQFEGQVTWSRIDCNSVGSSEGLVVGSTYVSGGSGALRAQGRMALGGVDISNCTTAIRCEGSVAMRGPVASIISGTGNTTGTLVQLGGNVMFASTTTLTGTTEISLEGTATTLAALRALSPKRMNDGSTNALIMEP